MENDNKYNLNIKKIKIVYYSGTGGTQRVSHCFEETFKNSGYEVTIRQLTSNVAADEEEYDFLMIIYAVHACNAPEPVYKWIDDLKPATRIPAAVISVSGGGEVSPNTACRSHCIKRLEGKGCDVVYERMLVMPSNWIIPCKESIALLLLEVLPKRVLAIVNDITKGINRRTKPLMIDRFFSFIGEFEKRSANKFGKRIKVLEKCNGCGLCFRNCPAGNIVLNMSKPKFGNKCNLCLGCIYGCPCKALEPGSWRFVIIKEGYSLNELEKKLPFLKEVNIEKLTKGYIWSGVRKYLLNFDDK